MNDSRSSALAVALILAACGSPATTNPTVQVPAASPGPAPRHNIVVFMADDLDRDLFNGMLAAGALPHVQRHIVDRGVTFRNAYTASPLCCPSRVSLLTGQFPHNTGVYDNRNWEHGGFEGFFRSRREDAALPTWFAAAGLPAGLVGKYLNGYPRYGVTSRPTHPADVPPGWRFWFVPLQNAWFFDYTANFNGTHVRYPRNAPHPEEPHNYRTDVEARRGEEFLDAAGASNFFLLHSVTAPHVPAHAAPRHGDGSHRRHAPRTPAFNEADVRDKPGWIERRARCWTKTRSSGWTAFTATAGHPCAPWTTWWDASWPGPGRTDSSSAPAWCSRRTTAGRRDTTGSSPAKA